MRNSIFLKRERINKILLAVYNYPLTILEAPMGYGKTTAVKNFFEAEKMKPFWFTFPDLSHSEVSFWNQFADAVSLMNKRAGLALKSLGLPADAPQIEEVLRILSDALYGKKLIMVLDDYHLVRDAGLKKLLMRFALEELDGLHILLITRDTGNIDFVELLSKGLCFLVSREHLKFTGSEVRDYCRTMLEDITDEDLGKIYDFTDGWISFIYITLLGLENGIPVGLSTTMEEMVEKALFAPYDRDIQDFLLKLSVMENFTVKQAEFVANNINASSMLKKLNRENAFIFYDEINKTYKIHNVLLDYLRLKQNFSAEELCGLYSRIGDWYLEKQDFQTAYGYWNRAGQTEWILAHLNNPQNTRNVLVIFDGVDEMFDRSPRDMLFRYPLAYLLYICHSIVQGKQNALMGWEERLDELQKHYEKTNNVGEDYRNRILGEILIIRKVTRFNHLSEMMALDKEIIRLLNGQNSWLVLRGYLIMFGLPQYLFLYFRDAGSLRELSYTLAEYNEIAKYADGLATGCDSLALAEYALETGELDKVEQNSLRAIAKAETVSQANVIFGAKFCLIRMHIMQGRCDRAFEMLEQLQRYFERLNYPFLNTPLDLCKAYVYASLCQPERIPSWLQVGDMASARLYHPGIAYTYLVYGKTLMSLKKYAKLEALISHFKKYFSLYNNRLGFIHNQIFDAAAKCGLYGTEAGTVVLETALDEARSDMLVMPFVESAPHILEMLKLIVRNNPGDAYVNRIFALCRKYCGTIRELSYQPASLSQREADILSLAAEGLGRKEIAVRLCISEETTKSHFKKIYRKLGVSSKVSAIKIAQDRGYLENV
jgi:LuxR family maltose regulon positive regulatory protein